MTCIRTMFLKPGGFRGIPVFTFVLDQYWLLKATSSSWSIWAGGEFLSPPRSPDLTLERGREFKENKEPSPKVKRRRSVKISSVALEPAQWQNDSLQILTCATDYKTMNEFLMKKVPNVTQIWNSNSNNIFPMWSSDNTTRLAMPSFLSKQLIELMFIFPD